MIEIQMAELQNSDCIMFNLSLDGHLILKKYYGDREWIIELENKIKLVFPHLINLSASQVREHKHCIVLKHFVTHQENHFKRYIHGDLSTKSFFDHDYNPCHYFDYEIPLEAIA